MGAKQKGHEIPKLEGRSNDVPSNGILAGLHDWRGHTTEGVSWEVHRGDVKKVLATLQEARFHCVITSPPYFWQRDYNIEGQIGKEPRIEEYVRAIADAMQGVKRVLRRDGLLFLNLGDTYYSAKGEPKGIDRKKRGQAVRPPGR